MRSLAQSLVDIYRTEGVLGLWKGSVPSIIKVGGGGGWVGRVSGWVLNTKPHTGAGGAIVAAVPQPVTCREGPRLSRTMLQLMAGRLRLIDKPPEAAAAAAAADGSPSTPLFTRPPRACLSRTPPP